jgi:acyl-CoA synthetase (NDP forming)
MAGVDRRLASLFRPRSIAFVGASNAPRKWGYLVLANLINGGFEGAIYPVNPKEPEVQGIKACESIARIPEVPDLAVIVVPPPSVPGVIDECVAKGVRAGVIITAGFAEVGPDGERMEREMVERARKGGMCLAGPNCNGIMIPSLKLYSAMPPVFPPPGPLGVVAQSGNVATSIARRGMKNGFGCSCFVSTGNEADLHCEDYFGFLADDPDTKVILTYVEGFRDGRRFFEVAREVTRKKPIVMIKGGGTEAGARAAMSHTASLAGADQAFAGACRQAGVIRAWDLDNLVNIGAGVMRQPLPKGNRVGILTGGGGWGVLAADASARAGLEVVRLPEATLRELDGILPPWWSRSNPVDLVAGLREGDLANSLECLLRCPAVDGVVLLGIMPAIPLRPLPASAGAEAVAERIQAIVRIAVEVFDGLMELADRHEKPVVIGSEIFPAGDLETQLAEALGSRGYVCYPKPEDAVAVMAALVESGRRRRRE